MSSVRPRSFRQCFISGRRILELLDVRRQTEWTELAFYPYFLLGGSGPGTLPIWLIIIFCASCYIWVFFGEVYPIDKNIDNNKDSVPGKLWGTVLSYICLSTVSSYQYKNQKPLFGSNFRSEVVIERDTKTLTIFLRFRVKEVDISCKRSIPLIFLIYSTTYRTWVVSQTTINELLTSYFINSNKYKDNLEVQVTVVRVSHEMFTNVYSETRNSNKNRWVYFRFLFLKIC